MHPPRIQIDLDSTTPVNRQIVDQLRLHREVTAAAIAEAPLPSGSPLIDNLLAALVGIAAAASVPAVNDAMRATGAAGKHAAPKRDGVTRTKRLLYGTGILNA